MTEPTTQPYKENQFRQYAIRPEDMVQYLARFEEWPKLIRAASPIGLPADAFIERVHYDHARRCLVADVGSTTFDSVPFGQALPSGQTMHMEYYALARGVDGAYRTNQPAGYCPEPNLWQPNELIKLIGQPAEGDQWNPLAATWHHERKHHREQLLETEMNLGRQISEMTADKVAIESRLDQLHDRHEKALERIAELEQQLVALAPADELISQADETRDESQPPAPA